MLIHSLIQHVLSVYYVQVTVLGARNTSVNQIKLSALVELTFLRSKITPSSS